MRWRNFADHAIAANDKPKHPRYLRVVCRARGDGLWVGLTAASRCAPRGTERRTTVIHPHVKASILQYRRNRRLHRKAQTTLMEMEEASHVMSGRGQSRQQAAASGSQQQPAAASSKSKSHDNSNATTNGTFGEASDHLV